MTKINKEWMKECGHGMTSNYSIWFLMGSIGYWIGDRSINIPPQVAITICLRVTEADGLNMVRISIWNDCIVIPSCVECSHVHWNHIPSI